MLLLNLKNSYVSGKIAEFIARVYLRLHGFCIVSSRYIVGRGTNAGEVDIIAKRGKLLIFVEVKKRETIDLAKEVIFAKQQQRIIKSAEVFLSKYPRYAGFDCRFDAICFDKHYRFEYIKNAWIS